MSPPSKERTNDEEQLFVELIAKELKNAGNGPYYFSHLNWDGIVDKFNNSSNCTTKGTKYELQTLWRRLKSSAEDLRNHFGDHVLSHPVLGKVDILIRSYPSKHTVKAKPKLPKKSATKIPTNLLRRSKRKLHSADKFYGDVPIVDVDGDAPADSRAEFMGPWFKKRPPIISKGTKSSKPNSRNVIKKDALKADKLEVPEKSRLPNGMTTWKTDVTQKYLTGLGVRHDTGMATGNAIGTGMAKTSGAVRNVLSPVAKLNWMQTGVGITTLPGMPKTATTTATGMGKNGIIQGNVQKKVTWNSQVAYETREDRASFPGVSTDAATGMEARPGVAKRTELIGGFPCDVVAEFTIINTVSETELGTNTAGVVANNAGMDANNVGMVANTGGMVANTGGMVANTGGMVANTGGMVANTGGMVANTGGMVANNVGMDANNVGMVANNVGMVANNVGMVANNVGMVANKVGMVANKIGMVANTAGMVANKVGMVANTAGMVANNAGMVENTAGIVANTSAMEANKVGMEANKVGMVANTAGMVANNSGMVANNAGMVANNAGMVANNAGMVANNAGMVANNAGMVANNGGMVANNAGMVANTAGVVANTAGVVANTSGMEANIAGMEANIAGLEANIAGIEANKAGMVEKRLVNIPRLKSAVFPLSPISPSSFVYRPNNQQVVQTSTPKKTCVLSSSQIVDPRKYFWQSELLAQQQQVLLKAQSAMERNLCETKIQGALLANKLSEELHEWNLKHSNESHAQIMQIQQCSALQNQKLENVKMKNEERMAKARQELHESQTKYEEQLAQQSNKLQEAKLRAMELSEARSQELHVIDMETARLKREEAEANNKLAQLRLKQIESELKHLDNLRTSSL